jgi:glyoxylase-like metal-dependent hydrolase (beta-lactamase superfamily II)
VRNTGGHSACSSYAYLALEGVVIAGDLVQADQYAYFGDPTTDMNAWIETLGKWEKMSLKKVCSGHGREVGMTDLVHIREFFEEMMAALKKLKKDDVVVRDAVFHASLPKGYWPDGLERPGWYNNAIAFIYQGL